MSEASGTETEGGVATTPRDYEVAVHPAGPCRLRLEVTVGAARVKKELDKTYGELSKTVQVKGFRPGKVPRNVLERRFGKHVSEDILHSLPHEILEEVIEQQGLEPLGHAHPEKAALDHGSVKFECSLDTKPKFDLPSLEGLKAARPKIEIKDAEIDEKLRAIAAQEASWEKVDSAIQAGDLIVADAAFEGGDKKWEDESVWIDADAKEIETFDVPQWESSASGKKAGETVSVAAKTKDGIDGTMLISIREVKRRKPPELTDAWAKEQNFEDLKTMREHHRSEELRKREAEADSELDKSLLAALGERASFEMPESLIARAVERQRLEKRYELLKTGISGEDLTKAVEAAEPAIRQEAERAVKSEFILDKIAAEEKIFVTEDEVEQKFAEMAQRTGQPIEQIRGYYENRGLTGQLREGIRFERARQFLRSKAEIT